MKCCPSAVSISVLKGHTIPYFVRHMWVVAPFQMMAEMAENAPVYS